MTLESYTPRELVAELDRYIVGQKAAKRAVAVALRNRWRRQHVRGPLKDEITPKNILMIGPTGCGKTEIARRLAKLAKAPFVKVEASKYTEVGYVGRDVESMIRDLVEVAVKLVESEALERVQEPARQQAEERILDRLLPTPPKPAYEEKSPAQDERSSTREKLRRLLKDGHLDEREVEVETQEQRGAPMLDMLGGAGLDQMGINMRDALGGLFPKKSKKRRVKVKEALEILAREEAERLIDRDAVQTEALSRAQENGIIFLDEIDKIGGREGKSGPDVSREGVQRDLLPIVEGSTVNTKYGMVKTDHILFIAAGAFHMTKVSDLIPEMQGRFPIRVELEALKEEDFVRILSEPENSLTRQYQALMETEAVHLEFTPEGIRELATFAFQVNERLENIGARRLHTVMERLLDELSFDASDREERVVVVDQAYVQRALSGIVQDPRLENYIL